MEEDKTTVPEIIWSAFVTASMFIPVHYLSNIFNWKFKGSDIFVLLVIPLICGLFMAFMLFSERVKYALAKWILSVPISFGMWLYFFNRDFYIRSLNWIFPSYGESNAGGSFAGFIAIMLLAFTEMPFVGIAIGISRKVENPKSEKALKIMKIITSVVCIIITLIVLHLNTIMPQYKPVYG